MKFTSTSYSIFIFILFSWYCPNSAHSEGAKEISVNGHQINLYLCNDYVGFCNNGGLRNPFAIYNCTEPNRLYFSTASTHEIVYMGFHQGIDIPASDHIVFRIKNLAGTIVYPERTLPVSGIGYIANIGQADIGPSQIYGMGGYNAFDWHPASPELFYIEFMIRNSSSVDQAIGFTINMIDITVYDSVALQVKPGRLYSKAWQFYEDDYSIAGTGYYGTNYIYSADSVVTSAAFQDLRGGIWVQYCNQWGCANTGNFTIDRKSLYEQRAFIPEYPVFVNPPDTILYPTATILGEIVPPDPYGDRNCNNGHIIFHVNVDKVGSAECDLTFPLPYTTRILTNNVILGENLITWDGLDGSGVPVPNNILVTLTVKYINGLTNLPLYDVEFNIYGFTIGLIRPLSNYTPRVYWDDTNIPAGTTNLAGCISPPGCHSWNGGPPDGFGNLNTVNTWWYNVTSTTLPVTLSEFRRPQTLVFQQIPLSYCAGTAAVYFSVTPDPNTEVYNWAYTGTGAVITQTNPWDAFIRVTFSANSTSGNITVYGTNANCIDPSQTSSLAVTVKPIPFQNPPFTKSICSGLNTNIVLTSSIPGSSFSWTNPPPSCTANIVACPPGVNNAGTINDVLSVSNLLTGMVIYHVTPTYNGCSGPLTNDTVNVSPLPDVVINSTTPSICSGETTSILLSSLIPGATFSWTALPSSLNLTGFALSGTGDILQTIINTGLSTETVTYTITASDNGCVNTTPTIYVVDVYPTPDLIINPATLSICSGQTATILLSSGNPVAIFSWTANGSSSDMSGFSDGTASSIIQTLVNSGFNPGTVTYHITAAAAGCTSPVNNYTVTVTPVADVYFTPPSQTFCSGVTSHIQLQSHTPGATFSWMAAGSSPDITGYASGSGNLIQQVLTNTGYNVENVTYSVTPTINGCDGVPAQVIATVDPLPVVSLTPCWDLITTTTAQPIKLKGGLPLGGTFSGAGISNGKFFPAIAGIGPHNINYSYINGFGCSGSTHQSITVIVPPGLTCGNTLTDIRDNHHYATVKIGTQCWMAANLNFGNAILSSQMQRDNCISEKYCYGDIPITCDTLGGLYQWDEMMRFDMTSAAQGFCPPGWHIPTETDWTKLFNYYINYGYAASALKYLGFSGFNAYLSGMRHENTKWDFQAFATMLWSSTASAPDKAWAHGMNSPDPSVSYYPSLRANAFSVRCIKD